MSPRRMRPAAKPMIALAALASAALVAGPVLAVTGNISPSSIEIDGPVDQSAARRSVLYSSRTLPGHE